MRATPDTPATKRTDRRVCPWCEASPGACDGVRWLAGRWCCEACAGDHDTTDQPSRGQGRR